MINIWPSEYDDGYQDGRKSFKDEIGIGAAVGVFCLAVVCAIASFMAVKTEDRKPKDE